MGLQLEHISISLASKPVLADVSFTVHDGEFVSLLGASGAGKSTTLKIISGTLAQDSGQVLIDGLSVDNMPSYKRGAVIVFQDIRLFPNMNVIDNVAFSLKMQGVKREARLEQAREMLSLVQLEGFDTRQSTELSGGQQQRVALARALAARPRVLLLDEPFSGLDEELRDDMRTLVMNLHDELALTTVLVTHDAAEAFMMSDRVLYMAEGRIIQDATPTQLFEHPASAQVAGSLGDCRTLEGVVKDGHFIAGDITLPTDCADGPATVIIRGCFVRPQTDSSSSDRQTSSQEV